MAFSINEKCSGCGLCKQWCPVGAIQGERRGRHTILSERCIECGACGRLCAFKAVQNSQGEVCTALRKSLWSRPVWDYAACTACKVCLQACPADAIGMREVSSNGHQFTESLPYLAAPDVCLGCGFCAAACTVGAVTVQKPVMEAK
jgi:Na+-translocating ferredoxin:NAD+ oxidoreductase subunit B